MKPIALNSPPPPLKSLSITIQEPLKERRNDDRQLELREHDNNVVETRTGRTLEKPQLSDSPVKTRLDAKDVAPSAAPADDDDDDEEEEEMRISLPPTTEETKSSAAEKLEFRERSLGASEESAIGRTLDTAFYTSMKMSKTSRLHVSNDLLHKAIVTGEEIDVLGILWDLGGGALQAITARDTEGRSSLHIATLVGSARIITLLLETYRLYEGQQLEYDLIRLNEEHQNTLDDLRKKIAILQANGSMNSNNKSIKREIEGQVAAVDEWFEKEWARR